MQILPDDIWLEVFSFLSLKDLLGVGLVCRTWHRLSRDCSLWHNLDLEPFARSLRSDVITRLINTVFAPSGRHLNLRKNLVTTQILQNLFESCRGLESLSLNECRLHSSEHWCEIEFNQVEALTFLDLRNSTGYAAGVENILQKADQLQFLGSYDKLIVYFMLTGDHLQTLLYCDSQDLQQNRTYLIVIVSSASARVS